jgi:membrane fusion protein (multidrug efflux system)
MLKRMLIMLGATGMVFGGLFGSQAYKASAIQAALSARKSPPQTIATTTTEQFS